jgi:hypothetical protein
MGGGGVVDLVVVLAFLVLVLVVLDQKPGYRPSFQILSLSIL